MAISQKRRRLLLSALGVSVVGGTLAGLGIKTRYSDNVKPAFLGCARSDDGGYEVTGVSREGIRCFSSSLQARGHGIALMRERSMGFVFARRPGRFIQTINTQNGTTLGVYYPPDDRIFYGHGDVYEHFLYTSEGVTETSDGIIGVYDILPSGCLHKTREFSGFGTGPHEVRVVNDETLAVAVGGIKTRGREKLNIDNMAPALVLLDRKSGMLKGRYELENHQLSIRHIAISRNGDVVVAQQYKGEDGAALPLLAILRKSGEFLALEARPEQWQRFNQYIGSVACTDSQIVATSPRGNCFGVWDLGSGKLMEMGTLLDASGASANQFGFAISSGSGRLVVKSAKEIPIYQGTDVVWDNHWVMLSDHAFLTL
ncbi:DUF1513 domain-containing protein [Enterovibrio nigricans]|uniref:DUF1513 domain-containing protein n=1 Tax=Enterovibrio nigricans DSM 22720 TaxID=1121868 RepID=A0A1T4UPR8_9GAMM|nr:DUF1513 domain-containing protein [Enterovibrio nigricans]PKF51061.1 DUF1513 domain-containing protein [Enterovibrio nigricans]SKA54707.1 hypothetical protein SAMN02745132_02186 [Enterovibrio nigricans DSM 22720]